MITPSRLVLTLISCAVWGLLPALRADPIDQVSFGDTASETSHTFQSDHSEAGIGGLGEPMRHLLPLDPPQWKGGSMSVTMKVDPTRQNYFTIRFWGSDVTEDRLVLFADGKQVGWYHLGEIEPLDSGNDDGTPGYNGRFFYHTFPLPLSLTQGKTSLPFQIRSMGQIWGYGTTWALYQKEMKDATRGVYRIYTHTENCFVPAADEKQGEDTANPSVRPSPGPEVLDQLKERVNHEIEGELKSSTPLNEIEMQFLANAYQVKWSSAYQNPKVISQVTLGIDHLYALWKADPKMIDNAPGVYNQDWLGFGPAGDAIHLLTQPLQPLLDQPTASGPTHRAAWSEMLQFSRDRNLSRRREYTNQTMIVDLNAYQDNLGLEAIDPSHALAEAKIRDYLYQSIGLEPWLGSDTDHGPAKPLGDDYWELTRKGLTRELGYVGYYGEVIDWVTRIYDATRPLTPDGFGPGDDKIRQQLIKIAKTRAIFRYPMLDGDGNRAMRIEAIVGWRDEGHYPGNVAYAERPSWDGTALYVVAQTLDPTLIGYAQQMFADNQFFASLEKSMKDKGLRVTAGLLDAPDEYETVKALPPSAARLPMSWEQPDFAWADEEDGVVALKRGKEILYASVYWRARNAVNSIARIHFMTPRFDRISEIREETEFEPSGLQYTYPDWANFGFANGGIRYPDEIHQAMAGETAPIAKIPDGIPFKEGQESPYAGRASFYFCRYGNYLIEMNADKIKPHPLKVPEDWGATTAVDLVSQQSLDLTAAQTIPPSTTVILHRDR